MYFDRLKNVLNEVRCKEFSEVFSKKEENEVQSKRSEKTIKGILIKNGFIELKNKMSIKKDIEIYEKILFFFKKTEDFVIIEEFVDKFFFIYQPFGSHNSPDFIIVCNGMIFGLEDKTSKKHKIMFNSHIPQRNFIYCLLIGGIIIEKQKFKNLKIICFGDDIIDNNPNIKTFYDFHISQKKLYDNMKKEYEDSLKGRPLNNKDLGFFLYPRLMVDYNNVKNIVNLDINVDEKFDKLDCVFKKHII